MIRLKALRVERSLTQRKLAEALGDNVKFNQISRWERGADIPVDAAMELGKFFQVDFNTLTDEVVIMGADDIVLKAALLPAEIQIMKIITEHPDRHQFGKEMLLKIMGVE